MKQVKTVVKWVLISFCRY